MKNIWKEEDIKVGMFIIRESSKKPSKDITFTRTVTSQITWSHGRTNTNYGLTSVMTDGWFCPIGKNKQSLADHLNNDEFGYRPATKEEILDMLIDNKQGFY